MPLEARYADVLLDTVLQRTTAGQDALMSPAGRLISEVELRLLGLVTGHTPLQVFVDMGIAEVDVQTAAAALTEAGLVAPV